MNLEEARIAKKAEATGILTKIVAIDQGITEGRAMADCLGFFSNRDELESFFLASAEEAGIEWAPDLEECWTVYESKSTGYLTAIWS